MLLNIYRCSLLASATILSIGKAEYDLDYFWLIANQGLHRLGRIIVYIIIVFQATNVNLAYLILIIKIWFLNSSNGLPFDIIIVV